MVTQANNAYRNLPRGCSTISPEGERSLKAKRMAMAEQRMQRFARRVRRFRAAGDLEGAEHALDVGERSLIRYRKEGLLDGS